jgi:ADP-ribose pyrophosphatase YjhB (NUDIX family)
MDHTNDSTFQVSVKGLFFNKENKILLVQDKNGIWDIPGGRIQKGEQFTDYLKREIFEETALDCEILDNKPQIIYPTIDKEGRGRIMVFYKINLSSLNFTKSDECIQINFFNKEEIQTLQTFPQLKSLSNYL